MKNNTIVTAGDINYLWGIFLLLASIRRSGMDEPIFVGTKKFDDHSYRVLKQFGNIEFVSLDHAKGSLACYKGEVMLKTNTEYITWIDSDGFFTGNCSELLLPPDDMQVHIRRRDTKETLIAYPPQVSLHKLLPQWKKDVEHLTGVAGSDVPPVEKFGSCCTCTVCLARKHEDFLRLWHTMSMTYLPKVDMGVHFMSRHKFFDGIMDKLRKTDMRVMEKAFYYPHSDECCFNACLLFAPNAPKVTATYQLDKDRNHLYIHNSGRIKPWTGWIPSSVRNYEATVSIVEWAISEKLELPSKVPYSLERSHKTICTMGARPYELWYNIKRRFKR